MTVLSVPQTRAAIRSVLVEVAAAPLAKMLLICHVKTLTSAALLATYVLKMMLVTNLATLVAVPATGVEVEIPGAVALEAALEEALEAATVEAGLEAATVGVVAV